MLLSDCLMVINVTRWAFNLEISFLRRIIQVKKPTGTAAIGRHAIMFRPPWPPNDGLQWLWRPFKGLCRLWKTTANPLASACVFSFLDGTKIWFEVFAEFLYFWTGKYISACSQTKLREEKYLVNPRASGCLLCNCVPLSFLYVYPSCPTVCQCCVWNEPEVTEPLAWTSLNSGPYRSATGVLWVSSRIFEGQQSSVAVAAKANESYWLAGRKKRVSEQNSKCFLFWKRNLPPPLAFRPFVFFCVSGCELMAKVL